MLNACKKILHAGLLALLFVATSAQATEQDCAQSVQRLEEGKPGKQTIQDAQKALAMLGFNTNGLDGILGSQTKQALQQFCLAARFAVNADLLLMLHNHALLFQSRPDWSSVLSSAAFNAWAKEQATPDAIMHTEQDGNAGEILALLMQFAQRNTQAPVGWHPGETIYSYGLDANDLKLLESGSQIAKLVEPLKNVGYASQSAFDEALAKALKDVPEPQRYMEIIRKTVQIRPGRVLTEAGLGRLKVKSMPDFLVQALQELKGLDYPVQEMGVAVTNLLGQQEKLVLALKPEIIKLIPCSDAPCNSSSISLSTDALDGFIEAHKKDALASLVAGKLQVLQGKNFSGTQAWSAAVSSLLQETAKQIRLYQPTILAETETTVTYILNESGLQAVDEQLQKQAVPAIYLDLVSAIRDVQYPSPELFWNAALAQVGAVGSNNLTRKAVFDAIDRRDASQVDAAVQEELKAAKLPQPLLDKLAALPKTDSPAALKTQVSDMFSKLADEFTAYRDPLVQQAPKRHPFDKSRKILLKGRSCNCVRNNLAGTVYGFYPYWLAGPPQDIDFSVLSRIGFAGLSFDDAGELANTAIWSSQDTGFIEEARTYGTRVDLVVYRNQWGTWGQLSAMNKTTAFKKLVVNIAAQLDIPLENFSSKVKPYISLGQHPAPVRADGVTLDFENYPQDSESIQAFKDFIGELEAVLQSRPQQRTINLMFQSREIGSGIYDYELLLQLLETLNKAKNKIDGQLIVMLQEPTTDDKKLLRKNIEDGLHGDARAKLLRGIVMTLTFDGHNNRQLVDDVIYARDNFSGIGFWPQIAASGVAAAGMDRSVSQVLQDHYLNTNLGEIAIKPAVCKIVCPNRWVFRIAWDIFMLALLLSAPLYFMVCSLRSLFEQKFIYFIAGIVIPAVLLTFALMFCDPSWESISRGNGILIAVITGVIGYAIWSYRNNKRKANLP